MTRQYLKAGARVVVGLTIATAACTQNVGFADPPASSYSAKQLSIVLDGNESTVEGAEVSSQFFDAARVLPFFGRFFIESEFKQSPTTVAVLSHKCWEDRFGSNPAAIGRSIQLDGRATTLIGIAQPGFGVPAGVCVWVPRTAQ
jgi:hypothetical protein